MSQRQCLTTQLQLHFQHLPLVYVEDEKLKLFSAGYSKRGPRGTVVWGDYSSFHHTTKQCFIFQLSLPSPTYVVYTWWWWSCPNSQEAVLKHMLSTATRENTRLSNLLYWGSVSVLSPLMPKFVPVSGIWFMTTTLVQTPSDGWKVDPILTVLQSHTLSERGSAWPDLADWQLLYELGCDSDLGHHWNEQATNWKLLSNSPLWSDLLRYSYERVRCEGALVRMLLTVTTFLFACKRKFLYVYFRG